MTTSQINYFTCEYLSKELIKKINTGPLSSWKGLFHLRDEDYKKLQDFASNQLNNYHSLAKGYKIKIALVTLVNLVAIAAIFSTALFFSASSALIISASILPVLLPASIYVFFQLLKLKKQCEKKINHFDSLNSLIGKLKPIESSSCERLITGVAISILSGVGILFYNFAHKYSNYFSTPVAFVLAPVASSICTVGVILALFMTIVSAISACKGEVSRKFWEPDFMGDSKL
jgi:hypothetical protein